MKRITMPVLVLVALLIFINSSPAWASAPVELGAEIHAGWSDFSNPDSDPTLDSHSILGFGLQARQGRLSLELGADWIETEVSQKFIEGFGILPILLVGNVLTVKGNLTIVPILLTGRLHLGTEGGMIDPYIGGGGGYYFLSYDPGSTATSITGGNLSHDINFQSTPGIHANLGLDIRVTPVMTFTIDARYVWANAKVSYKRDLAGLNSGANPLSLDGWVTTFGIKYYFKN
jgi:hypothetical protein